MDDIQAALQPAVAFAGHSYTQFQGLLQSNLPIGTIRHYEFEFLKFFNPELRSLNQLPTRAWPMTRVEVSVWS